MLHRRALHLQVSREQYLELVTAVLRRPRLALVPYMVDLLDLPDALLPHLPAPVGPKQLILLGNKVNLLPLDIPATDSGSRSDCGTTVPAPGSCRPLATEGHNTPAGTGHGTSRRKRILRPSPARCSETCGSSAPRLAMESKS